MGVAASSRTTFNNDIQFYSYNHAKTHQLEQAEETKELTNRPTQRTSAIYYRLLIERKYGTAGANKE